MPESVLDCLIFSIFARQRRGHQHLQRGSEHFRSAGRRLVDQDSDQDRLSVSTFSMFPNQLLLRVRITCQYVSVSTMTMTLSALTCSAAVRTSAALAVDLSTSTAIGIAFPYQLLLCFRINYYSGPNSAYLQRGSEHFGGAGRGLVDQDSDRDRLSVSITIMLPYQLLL